MAGTVKSIFTWAVNRPSYLLLVAADERLSAAGAQQFAHAWPGVMVLSLAWGLASAGLWGVGLVVFGNPADLPLMSTALVVGASAIWPYRRAVSAVGEVLGGGDSRIEGLVTCVTVIFWALALLGLEGWDHDWPTSLAPHWRWLRAQPMYRALLLAPLWGGWAMLIVPQFCRANGRTEPAVAAFAAGCGPLAAAACMGAIAAGTVLYFNYLPWRQLSISAAAVLAAIAGGVVLCRTAGGLNRRSLLAANLLTQLAFLAAYLANR